MQIVNLNEAPEHIPTLARWHHQEWSHLNPGLSVEQRQERLNSYLSEALVPSMLIAIEGDQVLGSAALIASDMDTHPELSPWLANVFVRADLRRCGLGGQLVKAIMDLAASEGLARIYLFTEDQEAFYAKMGWKTLTREAYRGSQVTIMQLDF